MSVQKEEGESSYRNTKVGSKKKNKLEDQVNVILDSKLREKIDESGHMYDFKVIQTRLGTNELNAYLTPD